MGLWFLLLPVITLKENKKQQHSTTFTKMAVDMERDDHHNLCLHMKKLVCFFSRACLATISFCKGRNVIIKKDKQDVYSLWTQCSLWAYQPKRAR